MIDHFKVIVSSIIFNEDHKVLLGKRSSTEDVFPGLWGIPGGKVEVEMTGVHTIEETLIREAQEEMGIVIKPLEYLQSSVLVKDGGAKIYIIFTARFVEGEPRALEDTEEVGWFHPDEIAEMDLTPHTYGNILDAWRKVEK